MPKLWIGAVTYFTWENLVTGTKNITGVCRAVCGHLRTSPPPSRITINPYFVRAANISALHMLHVLFRYAQASHLLIRNKKAWESHDAYSQVHKEANKTCKIQVSASNNWKLLREGHETLSQLEPFTTELKLFRKVGLHDFWEQNCRSDMSSVHSNCRSANLRPSIVGKSNHIPKCRHLCCDIIRI